MKRTVLLVDAPFSRCHLRLSHSTRANCLAMREILEDHAAREILAIQIGAKLQIVFVHCWPSLSESQYIEDNQTETSYVNNVEELFDHLFDI
jgi:hypothetical protein